MYSATIYILLIVITDIYIHSKTGYENSHTVLYNYINVLVCKLTRKQKMELFIQFIIINGFGFFHGDLQHNYPITPADSQVKVVK